MYSSILWALLCLLYSNFQETTSIVMVEICDNALDDDGDGLIDLNDPDCICNGIRDTFFIPSGLISNPSFEDYNECPDTTAQLYKCQNWIQASAATSDYFNTCDFWKDRVRGEPPLPLPAGNGYVGFLDIQNLGFGSYKEYVGSCLTSPMLPGKEYTLKFWIGFGKRGVQEFMGDFVGARRTFNMAIFGTSRCTNLPFGGGQPNPYLCPTAYAGGGWFEMTRLSVTGTNRWIQNTVKLRPNVPVESIVLGPACAVTDGNYFYWLDELILEETTKFDSFQFSINGTPCKDSVRLAGVKTSITSIKYQWYKDGVAILGATAYDYVIPPDQEGTYQLRAFDGNDCELSNAFKYQLDKAISFIDTILCEGQPINVAGNQIDKEGFYTIVAKRMNGCDSTIYLDLQYAKSLETFVDSTVCIGTVIKIGSKEFPDPGQYEILLQSSYGCDSLVNLKIVHVDFFESNFDTTICQGKFVIIENDTLSQTGSYIYNYMGMDGCDSMVTINLNIRSSDFIFDEHSICEGDTFYFRGIPYFLEGIYDYWDLNQFGCDSLTRLVIRINKNIVQTIDTTICAGDFLIIDNQQFDKSGNFMIPLTTNLGCDSIVQLNLTVLPSVLNSVDTIICETEVLQMWGRTFNQAGIYEFTQKDGAGCDEKFYLKLDIEPAYIYQLDTTICQGNMVSYRGNSYSQTGDYELKTPSAIGCDSIFRLKLQVAPISNISIDTIICSGEVLNFHDQVIDQSGSYIFLEKSMYECDSTIEVNLIIAPPLVLNGQVTEIKCDGQSDGKIKLNLSGGLPPYKILWKHGVTDSLLDFLAPGEYMAQMADQLGCSTTQTFIIQKPECFCFDFVKDDLFCFGEKGKLNILHQSGGLGPLEYFLNGQKIQLDRNTIPNLKPDVYNLRILDQNGCPYDHQFEIERKGNLIQDLGVDTLYHFVGDTAIILFGGKNKPNQNLAIDWFENGLNNCDTCDQFKVLAREGSQIYISVGLDEFGCEYTYQAIVIGKLGYWVPNVFSPNGDAVNDYFNLFTDLGFDRIDKLQIYDRWGGLLFESRDGIPNSHQGAWYGESNGKPVIPGVYTYLFLFKDRVGKSYKIAGDITLIR